MQMYCITGQSELFQTVKSISYASSYYRTVIPCTTAFLGIGWYTYTAETDVATAQMNVQWASVMGHRLPSRQSNSLLGSTGFFQSADISTVEEVPLSRKKIAIRMGWDGIPPNTIEYD